MKRLVLSAALPAALLFGCAGAAYAADSDTAATTALPWAPTDSAMVTKAPPLLTKAPPPTQGPPPTCTSVPGFFLTDCQLSWYGVRFYGTIDVGYGYQTHGAPWDPNFTPGASYLLQKMNRMSIWTLSPNGLSQSNIGIQIKEPLAPGWSFVAQLEGGFDPYSLHFANSPGSEFNNIGVPVNQQTTNGDSSRAGQFYNSLGFLGVSSDTYGTLTVFRQNALTLDAVLAYDPMAGSYAFSPLGFQGGFAGGGDTEQAKYTTSVKYRVNIGDFRVAALWQFGGYNLNNASNGAWEAQIGGDIRNLGPGTLSIDGYVDYNRDAVILALAGAPTNASGVPIGTMLPQTMTATLSDNTALMVAAKYTVDRLKLYAGYEWMQFAPPSDPYTVAGTGFTDIGGNFVCFACATAIGGTNINSTAYSASAGFQDKILQMAWGGARYSVTDAVDVVGAYYHYWQNTFAASAANIAACNVALTNKNFCAGSVDAASVLIDWKFAPKWDTYIGTFYSHFNGGLANGFLSRDNLATTAGIRFRF
jgi:predicted porin